MTGATAAADQGTDACAGRGVTTVNTFPSINPATGAVPGHAPDADKYSGGDSPVGGFNQSGVGREMGVAGLEEFLERKTFAVPGLTVQGAGA